ncbi:hypothetical protein A2955_03940 [Candidatus Woesebacteria bacterium RIFCSPLOWO2_01_FULL_37_19]|uniref:ABC transporter ATP-binding protein n=2 Tax=Candidatus Woeseibacteriota TaxID=1752722 RepID=A0A1F8B995_9BACT|nr:MAG: hypothetical protein A2771_03035 [Candidatus Woesebacteria bacterium RIFCSPHIGHO2_01_FULL_38_26b]OGM59918.1 MAG: hypothetical protein A2955_03940 [Candidatus Woesebacteria bacterium RIFCSPLOWO2_01_FULL_37_19]
MNEIISTLKIFYSFVARKKFWFIVFIAITIFYGTLYSILPYFYKLFVDGLENFNYLTLVKILIFYVLVRLVALLSSSLSFYVGDILSFDAAISARRTVFKHIQDLDFAYHASKSTGSLISAIKRGDGAMWELFHAIHHRFSEVLIGFAVMIYFLGRIDPRIAIFSFVSFVLAIFLTKRLVKINIDARKRHNEEEDKVSAIIVDNLVNFETVKLFSKENWELKRLETAFIDWLKYGWKFVNTFRLIDISVGSLINLSIFLVLFFGLTLLKTTKLTTGEFILILGFVNSFYPRLFDLVWSFRDVGKSYTDLQKYFEILKSEVEIKDPEKPIYLPKVDGEIVFRNVSFSYEKNKREAVKNINLNIRLGQSVAFVGRSGSGKTTLIKLLMRFYDLDQGKILIDKTDITKFTKSYLRSFIGIVPQEPVLFNNTIGYNIGYGKEKQSKGVIIAAAKIANLHDFIETLPKKYATHVGERGIKLSGGQKQRLAIARMVLSDPDIIIFDEATSQLDSENEKLIQEALWRVTKNKTTIIIAHRLSTARKADKIVVMEEGKIVETGSHNALINKDKSLYKYFWELQTNTV